MSTTSTLAGSVGPTRILITGAAGFVGRALVRAAASIGQAENLRVIACDVSVDMALAVQKENSRVLWTRLDVRDKAACAHLFTDFLPTHVLHAAAMTAGPDADISQVNVAGTEAVLAAAKVSGSLQRMLLVSSSAVYGSPSDELACDEDHPLDLRNPYAQTKWEAEQLLVRWGKQTGISTAIARLGPCYGQDETPGPFRPGISLVAMLLRAHRSGIPLRVSGVNYDRDWTDVNDAAHALLMLLLAPRLHHTVYNVSGGVAISALDLIRCIRDHGAPVIWTDRDDTHLVLSARDGRKPLIIDRLRADTGFTPLWDWKQRIAAMLYTAKEIRSPGTPRRPSRLGRHHAISHQHTI